jgi:hypothetical protein
MHPATLKRQSKRAFDRKVASLYCMGERLCDSYDKQMEAASGFIRISQMSGRIRLQIVL